MWVIFFDGEAGDELRPALGLHRRDHLMFVSGDHLGDPQLPGEAMHGFEFCQPHRRGRFGQNPGVIVVADVGLQPREIALVENLCHGDQAHPGIAGGQGSLVVQSLFLGKQIAHRDCETGQHILAVERAVKINFLDR